MCHVNMLKEYFDRDSSISKPITVVNTVPKESNVFEPEVNSDFIDKSDPGPSKLENSDILRQTFSLGTTTTGRAETVDT